jgi:hypothetical protein
MFKHNITLATQDFETSKGILKVSLVTTRAAARSVESISPVQAF